MNLTSSSHNAMGGDFILKLKKEHLPGCFQYSVVHVDDIKTVIRANLSDMNDIHEWVREFGYLTKTHWNCRKTSPCGERYICWKKFVCHHSSFNKAPSSSKSFKCEAYLLVKIKKNNYRLRYTDKYRKLGQCAVITIWNRHTHDLSTAETYLPPSVHTRSRFQQYFDNGMRISESCHLHEKILKFEGYTQTELSYRRINPSQRIVRFWYEQWRKKKFTPEKELMGSKSEEFIKLSESSNYSEFLLKLDEKSKTSSTENQRNNYKNEISENISIERIKEKSNLQSYDYGIQPERIIGATYFEGELMFVIKWKGCDDGELISSKIANVECPQIVINFYEERLIFRGGFGFSKKS